MQFTFILSTLLAAASAAVAVPLVDSIQHIQSVAHAHNHPMPATLIHVPKLMARTGTRISSDDARMSNSCNSGTAQCCQSLHQNSDTKSQSILSGLGLLGLGSNVPLDLDDLFVGLQCSPIGSIAGGASACNSKPVCCSGNHFDGLINIGCSPISL